MHGAAGSQAVRQSGRQGKPCGCLTCSWAVPAPCACGASRPVPCGCCCCWWCCCARPRRRACRRLAAAAVVRVPGGWRLAAKPGRRRPCTRALPSRLALRWQGEGGSGQGLVRFEPRHVNRGGVVLAAAAAAAGQGKHGGKHRGRATAETGCRRLLDTDPERTIAGRLLYAVRVTPGRVVSCGLPSDNCLRHSSIKLLDDIRASEGRYRRGCRAGQAPRGIARSGHPEKHQYYSARATSSPSPRPRASRRRALPIFIGELRAVMAERAPHSTLCCIQSRNIYRNTAPPQGTAVEFRGAELAFTMYGWPHTPSAYQYNCSGAGLQRRGRSKKYAAAG
jgi:hypothetical protein